MNIILEETKLIVTLIQQIDIQDTQMIHESMEVALIIHMVIVMLWWIVTQLWTAIQLIDTQLLIDTLQANVIQWVIDFQQLMIDTLLDHSLLVDILSLVCVHQIEDDIQP